jgi:hypothetical protein
MACSLASPLGGPASSLAMAATSAAAAAGTAELSLLTTGASCGGLVELVTIPASSGTSCFTLVTPTTSAALHAATNTDAVAIILAVEIAVIAKGPNRSCSCNICLDPAPILFAHQARISTGRPLRHHPRPTHAKAAKVSLDGSCRCVAFAWMCSASGHPGRSRACLATGRTASAPAPVRRQYVGANDPRCTNALTSDQADQAALLS